MKRILLFSIAVLLVAGVAGSASAQSDSGQNQSLGDFARAERAQKKPDTSKHFDNDTIPRTDKLSVVGQTDSAQNDSAPADSPAESSSTDSAATPDSGSQEASAPETPKKGVVAPDKQQANEELKTQIADAQSKVDLLTRELDVAQKESHLRDASFYGDAGSRLRNSSTWDKENAASKDQIADKQKALADAKQQLEDLQEQARKAGIKSEN